MFAIIICTGLVLTLLLIHLLTLWTSKKQRELSEQEFQVWFQKNCLGMNQSPKMSSEQPGHSSVVQVPKQR
jgi:hypothetical protein